ncbi:MAG: hypothetical protein ACTSSG_14185 [Candidatus Heimdallarchaeaceae archaeon]
MDGVLDYFQKFLRKPVEELGIYPSSDAKNMLDYYQKKKNEYLTNNKKKYKIFD